MGGDPNRILDSLCACQVLGKKRAIAPPNPDDDQVDKSNKKKASLYMVSTRNHSGFRPNTPISRIKAEPSCDPFCRSQISDASGKMKVTCVEPSSPFKQKALSPDECYILDNGVDRNIFVWKGVTSRDGLWLISVQTRAPRVPRGLGWRSQRQR